MGPRSVDRGISAVAAEISALVLASMGPRSVDRGIPEGLPANTKFVRHQWGRDQLIAELVVWGREQRPHVPASMGPRSVDRGIVSTRVRAIKTPFGFNGAAIS